MTYNKKLLTIVKAKFLKLVILFFKLKNRKFIFY